MDLVLYAKGHELASDLGYFGAMHWLTQDWIRTCAAHNTCLIRDEAGNHEFMHDAQGQLRTVFSGNEPVEVVELSERDPEALESIPGRDPVYQRTCALVQVADGPTTNHYALDIFRVRGGHWHDYMFHSQGRCCESTGADLEKLDPEISLYEASGFRPKQEKPHGSGYIRQLRKGNTDEAFSVIWRDVLDIRQTPPCVDTDAGLRLTVLGAGATEVYLGQAPGQRKMSNVDQGETLHVLCLRRRNTENVNRFVSILEPFQDKPFLRGATELPVQGQGSDAVALRVELGGRTDYAVSLASEDTAPGSVRVMLENDDELVTDGLFTFVSYVNGTPSFMRLCGGTRAAVPGLAVRQTRTFQGTLVDFDDEQKTVTVLSDRPLPFGNALEDEVIIIEHEHGTTSFTVDRIDAEAGERFHIRLKWSPHLLENRFRVINTADGIIDVEPPPSLPVRYGSMGYQVYRVETDGGTTHVARIESANAGKMVPDRAVESLAPGTMIGLTRMRKGIDRFRILGTATAERK
jgi:hypothetical protein